MKVGLGIGPHCENSDNETLENLNQKKKMSLMTSGGRVDGVGNIRGKGISWLAVRLAWIPIF